MIRVCHVITDLNAGGAERMLVNVATRLDRARFSNEVISLIEPGLMADELAAAGIPLTSLGMRRGCPSPVGIYSLRRHLLQSRPAVIQSWLYHADLAAALARWRVPETSLIWNLRCSDIVDRSADRRLGWVVRILARMSAMPEAVVVNSEKGREFHREFGYRPRRWIVIPNGVDTDRFHPRRDSKFELRKSLGITPDVPVIGFVARFNVMKDFPTFLQAASRFAGMQPNACFVLCGEGCDDRNDRLVRMVAELRLDSRVRLLGTRSDMEGVYPAFDVLTLSSAFGEGFPNVLIEAMACGVPCVATDVGDSRSIVADTGSVVPPRDPEALARGWESVVSASGSNALGDRARNRAVEHYGIDRVCQLYETLYQEVASQGR